MTKLLTDLFEKAPKVMLLFFAFYLICSCSSEEIKERATHNGQLDLVKIAVWGPRIIDFIDLYVGEELGYFRDAGIEVQQLSAQGAGDAIRNVIAGNAHIAMSDPFSAYFAIQGGAELKGFYCPYTKSWMKIVVNARNGIRAPEDLKGKTIAVTSQASTSRYSLMLFLAAHGLSEDDVQIAAVGRDFASALLGGSVDAASTWDSVNWGMFNKSEGPHSMGFDIWENELVPGPNDVYFSQSEWLVSHDDVIKRFVRAINQAKLWIAKNPSEAANLGPKYALGGDDLVRNRAVIEMRIAMQNQGRGVATNGVGWCDVQSMSQVAELAVKLGILSETLDLTSLMTNEFLGSI